jgi:hypothetical protein
MNFADVYFGKNQLFIPHIEEPPKGLLRFVTVIPAYLEERVFQTLKSVKDAALPKGSLEIIIVVNYSEADSGENKKINDAVYFGLVEWCSNNSSDEITFYPLLAPDLPKKHAGVGLARKIGMDEALWRFNSLNNQEGLILCLDADSLVDPNYFQVIEKSISANEKFGGCILYFEHPLEGTAYPDNVYNAILQYELHLRYYKHILNYTGFPYINYTIGSCFGVKAGFYAQQGGMNRRQAGEDFYFLNKLFPHREFAEITDTCVYPSPRPSMRVPFGTGASVTKLISQKDFQYNTYSPEAFYDLKVLFSTLESFYFYDQEQLRNEFEKWPIPLKEFLQLNHFFMKLLEIKSNSGSVEAFVKRFYQWFDGFKVVKYLNFAHEKYYPKVPVEQAIFEFMDKLGIPGKEKNATELLQLFRKLDRERRLIS